jgi:hypothetical protein
VVIVQHVGSPAASSSFSSPPYASMNAVPVPLRARGPKLASPNTDVRPPASESTSTDPVATRTAPSVEYSVSSWSSCGITSPGVGGARVTVPESPSATNRLVNVDSPPSTDFAELRSPSRLVSVSTDTFAECPTIAPGSATIDSP